LNSLHSLSPKVQDISDDLSTAKDQINTAVNALSEIRSSTSAVAVALPQLQTNFTHVAQSLQTLLPLVRNSLTSNSAQAAAHGLAIRDLEKNINIQYKNLTQSVDRRLIANLGHYQQQLVLISNSRVAYQLC
jgi:phage-related tail protein